MQCATSEAVLHAQKELAGIFHKNVGFSLSTWRCAHHIKL
jgi:hypothetical protein